MVLPAVLAVVFVTVAVVVLSAGDAPRKAGGTEPLATESVSRAVRVVRARPGDSLSQLAERYGISLPQLQDLNPRIDPMELQAGDRLRVPR